MSPGRCLRLALVLLMTASVYAAPARAARELRAAHCCATRCPMRAVRCDPGCCQVRQAAPEVARLAAAPAPGAAGGLAVWVAPPAPALVGAPAAATPPGLGRAGPLFLLTRTLRL